MNEYAKEGKMFLKAIDDYFKEFETVTGCPVISILRQNKPCPDNAPDPIKIIDSLNMLYHSEDTDLTLYFRGMKGFDGYCTFLDRDGKISDKHIRVSVSDNGVWQLTLLLVLSMHVMPMYWHARYMHWKPIFCDNDLQKLRKSKQCNSILPGETYDFIPKVLPTEPQVMTIEAGQIYQTSFYAWSDFAGYIKITSTITFPGTSSATALVRDVEIEKNIEKIVPYRRCVIL